MHPEISGRIILEDLSTFIGTASVDMLSALGIEATPGSLFRSQPLGMASYIFGTILHYRPDIQALKILGHVKKVMGLGDVLLIKVLADIAIMVLLAWRERRLTYTVARFVG